MKYVWHWKVIDDWYKEDSKFWEINEKFQKAMKENPDDFPKLSPSMHTGRDRGFRLVEGTEEQLANLVQIWAPVEDWRLEPYFEIGPDSAYGKAWRRWNT